MDPENPSSNRRGLAAALVGIFVLYVLSIGPVGYLSIRAGVPAPRFGQFYAPLGWVMKTPVGMPLRKYVGWWGNRAFVDRNNQRKPR